MIARDSGGATQLRNDLAGVPRDVVPPYVREVVLNLVASGRQKKLTVNENRRYVEKAIMDEPYATARRANIPSDEVGQVLQGPVPFLAP